VYNYTNSTVKLYWQASNNIRNASLMLNTLFGY